MNEKARLTSVSELIKTAWGQYSKHFKVLVPITLVAGIGLYLQTIVMYFSAPKVVNVSQYGVEASSLATYGILSLIATVIYAVGMIWGFTALVNQVNKLDQPMTLKDAFMKAKPFIWSMFITGLLVAIFTIIGFILIIIPGIIVGVWLSFATYIVIAENKSGMEAIKASKAYVEGYWWPVFGRAIVVGIIVALIAGIIGGIANMIIGQTLGMLLQNVISLALIPFAVLCQYAIYQDLKKIKSGAGSFTAPAPQPPVATPAV